MEKINTIIFHQGYQDYLKLNCLITSKKNNIFLLGDESLKSFDKFKNVTFIDVKKYVYDESIETYKKNFQPLNTTPEKFVWLWYLRIFVMKLFLEEYNFSNIFHIDSDNILFEDINNFKFNEDNAYLINKNYIPTNLTASIHCGLLNSNFFSNFTKLYEDIFVNKSKFGLIEEKIKYHEKHGKGGICDMTLFYLLHSEKLLKVQNLMAPIISSQNNEEYIFMDNFSDPTGDKIDNQFRVGMNKRIKIYNDSETENIFLYDKFRKKKMRLINIHFQGSAKKFMNEKFLKRYL